MERKTLNMGRETIKPNTGNNATARFQVGIGAQGINQNSGERNAEAYLIDKVRDQISTMKDRIVSLNGFAITINNQNECILLLSKIQQIVNEIGLTTAVNYVVFDVVHIINEKLYSWKFKATPQMKDIRRESDIIKVELIEVPEHGENPIRNAATSVSFPITYVLAGVEWRYL